eukprot:233677-Pelagomonas_calceolata.AAC.9
MRMSSRTPTHLATWEDMLLRPLRSLITMVDNSVQDVSLLNMQSIATLLHQDIILSGLHSGLHIKIAL